MIRFLLLSRIEWSDKNQALMLCGVVACALVMGMLP